MGPGDLHEIVANLELKDERILSSLDSSEDAAVFALNDETSLVQTLDFITPVVGDPFIFGQIAAANALSDVFAMGGNVLTALNILCFDSAHFSSEIAALILQGALNKVCECGGSVIGGHSIKSKELYFGLSVTGLVKARNFWANNTAQIGDMLILTKPLGSGILSTALKNGKLENTLRDEMIAHMTMLNFYAANALKGFEIHACTDITGFGFLGHLSEMLNEKISFEIFAKNIPLMRGVNEKIASGFVPGGTLANKEFTSILVDNQSAFNEFVFYDAQTSGGLLIALNEKDAQSALNTLKNAGYESASIVGSVHEKSANKPIKLLD